MLFVNSLYLLLDQEDEQKLSKLLDQQVEIDISLVWNSVWNCRSREGVAGLTDPLAPKDYGKGVGTEDGRN